MRRGTLFGGELLRDWSGTSGMLLRIRGSVMERADVGLGIKLAPRAGRPREYLCFGLEVMGGALACSKGLHVGILMQNGVAGAR
jgi:hypothetical protein